MNNSGRESTEFKKLSINTLKEFIEDQYEE